VVHYPGPSLHTQTKHSLHCTIAYALWSSFLQCVHLLVRTVANALPPTPAPVVLNGPDQTVTDQVCVSVLELFP
jgi:hypothetical protein